MNGKKNENIEDEKLSHATSLNLVIVSLFSE